MAFVLCLIGFLPSFLQRPLRNLLGAELQSGSTICMFNFVLVRKLKMAKGARIGRFCFLRAEDCELGARAVIRGLSVIKVRKFALGEDAIVDPLVLVNCDESPQSQLTVGRHSRVFSFSVLEPSEGIYIGDQTGIGGQSLIFSHGSWPNYLEGAPYNRGPVHIGNEVWLPWRVMILPNSNIGEKAIIGAHSLVRGSVPAGALYSGVPAKEILPEAWKKIGTEERLNRFKEIVSSFHRYHGDKYQNKVVFAQHGHIDRLPSDPRAVEVVLYSFDPVSNEQAKRLCGDGESLIDLSRLTAFACRPIAKEFVGHLSTYGVRLSQLELE